MSMSDAGHGGPMRLCAFLPMRLKPAPHLTRAKHEMPANRCWAAAANTMLTVQASGSQPSTTLLQFSMPRALQARQHAVMSVSLHVIAKLPGAGGARVFVLPPRDPRTTLPAPRPAWRLPCHGSATLPPPALHAATTEPPSRVASPKRPQMLSRPQTAASARQLLI